MLDADPLGNDDTAMGRSARPTIQSGLTDALDAVRRSLAGKSRRADRSEIGQFLTPAPIAKFMASLFDSNPTHARILDPGAGIGVLFAATVEALISQRRKPTSIEVVAYETDRHVIPYLQKTMARCKQACDDVAILFRGTILAEDFIAAGIAQVNDTLYAGDRAEFTHAILNPPYMKINGHSHARRLLSDGGMDVSNLYAGFVWLAARMLAARGQLAAITPRSFCNGPYFRQFRVSFLNVMNLQQVHLFGARNKAFVDDSVLQENVILHATREKQRPGHVTVSSSEGPDFREIRSHRVPYDCVVSPSDRDAFLHLVQDADDCAVMKERGGFTTSLQELGLEVSTGRVVDFRAQEFLRPLPENGTVPLIYPCHFTDGFVDWPAKKGKKPNAVVSCEQTRDLLVQSGHYVLTKRFTTKEEPRRVVPAVYDPKRIDAPLVGFENHLNYFHVRGTGLPRNVAKGLAVYLNSSLLDRYFRLFSGHTQVNATDLRRMRYPTRRQLMQIGSHVRQRLPNPETADTILDQECS